MQNKTKSQGRWIFRFTIRLFTIVLCILVYWALGFMVEDIRTIPGPKYKEIEKDYLNSTLVENSQELKKEIDDLARQIDHLTKKQNIIGDSSQNLQQTVTQLFELQSLGLQKNINFSDTEMANFSDTLQVFLENQKKYQALSQDLSEMLEQKQGLVLKKEQIDQEIAKQQKTARKQYDKLANRHRLQLAFLQLAILLPILAMAVLLVVKKRTSMYVPLYWALGVATLFKVALVMHEYFPSKFFKYVLIIALLLTVIKLLIYFIRSAAFPKADWLVKQYREAYERFLCPVCDYPIRTGPRRYLFWTRRTVNKIVVPNSGLEQEEAYVCPSCTTELFAECSVCHKIRHTMLPGCQHCGAIKDIA